MNTFWKTLFIGAVSVELVVIGFLWYATYRKKQIERNVLGAVSVNPIKKENLIFHSDAALKYYYEPKPNSIIEGQPLWRNDDAHYTVNSDTLNERYDYSVQKASDSARIVVMGDSFAFSQHVDTKNNWSEQLEDKLNKFMICPGIIKYEVINLGYDGYDIEYAVHRYNTRGKKYDSDVIIWYLVDNDFIDINEFLFPFTEKFEKILTKQDFEKAALKGDFYPAHTLGHVEYHKMYSKKFIFDYIYTLLQRFNVLKSQLILVIDESVNEEQKDLLKRWIQEGNEHIKLTQMVPLEYFPDYHPNLESQKVIAENLFSYLKKNNFISCEASQSGNPQ
jgi:hypothetical protein